MKLSAKLKRMAEILDSKMEKPSICVDFDGTIFKEVEYPAVGEVFEGVREALLELKKTYCIRIYTCRLNGANSFEFDKNMEAIKNHLDTNGIPYDDIVVWNEGKPFADYYIDNRGINFNGNWNDVVTEIKNRGVQP